MCFFKPSSLVAESVFVSSRYLFLLYFFSYFFLWFAKTSISSLVAEVGCWLSQDTQTGMWIFPLFKIETRYKTKDIGFEHTAHRHTHATFANFKIIWCFKENPKLHQTLWNYVMSCFHLYILDLKCLGEQKLLELSLYLSRSLFKLSQWSSFRIG